MDMDILTYVIKCNGFEINPINVVEFRNDLDSFYDKYKYHIDFKDIGKSK